MPDKLPVNAPGRYVAPTAVGFADGKGELALVTSEMPLPVRLSEAISTEPPPPALSGTTVETIVAGPFVPVKGTPIHLQLSGIWQGTVTVQRSTDGGATRQGLTVGGMPWASFSGNVNEPIWQEGEIGTSFWIDVRLLGGELSYRVSQ